MKLFDSSTRRAIEDFRAYAAEHAIAFPDLDAIDENARQLSILDPLIAGKRFAYIGESDHFIHEKYPYRLAMLNYLAARGFTHLGEELGASDGMRIARFIETGDDSQLERVTIYGYKGASRSDRDDTPTGILRDSFGDAYPTAQFAAEQKRFAHGLRKFGVRFFGFDIDPLPGGGYELAAVLNPQIVVQQNYVNWAARQYFQSFSRSAAMAGHFKSRLRGQQPAEAFTKQHVVVKQ